MGTTRKKEIYNICVEYGQYLLATRSRVLKHATQTS